MAAPTDGTCSSFLPDAGDRRRTPAEPHAATSKSSRKHKTRSRHGARKRRGTPLLRATIRTDIMTASIMSNAFGPKPPLRGEDLPCDDSEPMESERHWKQMVLLASSLRDAWADRHDVYIGANMAVYFSEIQARNQDFRAPDVFVVLDTDDHERKSWVVWEEDGRVPDVVIELVSESTEHIDRGRKKDVYARLRVPCYVIFDPFSTQLDVYRLDASGRRYEATPKDGRGYARCEPLELFVGVVPGMYGRLEAPWLRWIDREGHPLVERAEREADRAERAEQRAEREAERANQAEAELAALRAQLASERR
jgi:Uma2 family endonuclease